MRSMQDRSRWSEPTSDDEAHARAAGRRRHNALRRFRAQLRRVQVLNLAGELGGFHHGVQAEIARALGVSKATISRDLQRLCGPGPRARCPCCGCGGHPAEPGRIMEPTARHLPVATPAWFDRRRPRCSQPSGGSAAPDSGP
jgi:hypothetical protein